MLDKDYILSSLKEVSIKYPQIRVGLAGSYANGTATESSNIDVVIILPSELCEDLDYCFSFLNLVENELFLGYECSTISLPDLKRDDERIDKMIIEMGLPANDESMYKNIIREVIWCN